MKHWFNEDILFRLTVLSVGNDNRTENHCRAGHETGDVYEFGYGCPKDFCQKSMIQLFPILEAARSGGDLRNLGGNKVNEKEFVCPDGVVRFKLEVLPHTENENFHTGGFYRE